MNYGIVAGFSLIDIKVSIVKGKFVEELSTEAAFSIAGRNAFRSALQKAIPKLLEPAMKLEIVTPVSFTGEVVGDLSSRSGRVRGMEEQSEMQVIFAEAPLARLFGYSTRLRSLTQGRATFTMHFSHYSSVTDATKKALIGE